MSAISEPEHYLSSFLQSALPALGLDSDTYGPYLLGLFPLEEVDETDAIDEEELQNVLELLQGSSETHADQDEAFVALKAELMLRKEQYRMDSKQKAEQLKTEAIKQQEEQKRRSAEEVERLRRTMDEKKTMIGDDTPDKLLKLRLIQQYAYDDSIQYDSKGDPIEPENTTVSENINRLNKELEMKERQAHLKKDSEKTKKTAREETAKQNLMKAQAKEERRQRATKGERKR